MATLPRAVQRQIEQADAIVQKINTPAKPEGDQNGGQADDNGDGDTQTPANPPADGNTVETNQAPAPAPAPTVDWEHKFKTLQGLFNAEVPKLQQQVKELTAQMAQAKAQAEAHKAKPEPALDDKPEANAKDVEEFGEDLVQMVQRQFSGSIKALSAKIDTMLNPLLERVQVLEQRVEGTAGTVQLTAEEMFFDRLEKSVPGWEQVNVDPRFIDWLSEVDPVYGEPRRGALTHARQTLDVGRVSAIFKAFLNTLPKQQKTDTLAKQISPKAGAASSAPKPVEKPVIKQSDVTEFYHQVASGKFRGREKEMADMEAVINLALAEGRIQ